MERAMEGGFSRIPAFSETTDNIIGLAYLKDLVRQARAGGGTAKVRESVRPATFVPEQKRVAELLREMQSQQFHMAMVVDEHGGTAGLVTLEDLLEEIVGEISDEYDTEELMVEKSDHGYLVDARLSVQDLSELVGLRLPDEDWDTVGGLILGLAGRVPEEGETFEIEGLRLTAERVQGRRVSRVRVSVG
jgi:CBS domain containing-hemolysin-like protein